jgi:hypothetical protein
MIILRLNSAAKLNIQLNMENFIIFFRLLSKSGFFLKVTHFKACHMPAIHSELLLDLPSQITPISKILFLFHFLLSCRYCLQMKS